MLSVSHRLTLHTAVGRLWPDMNKWSQVSLEQRAATETHLRDNSAYICQEQWSVETLGNWTFRIKIKIS